MANGATATLEGMGELLAKLEQLGNRVQGGIENQALNAGAQVVQKAASSRSKPRSQGTVGGWKGNGHILDHIGISKVYRKDGFKCVDVGPTKGDTSHWFYGKFLEFGTVNMPAQPFMGPSFEENKKRIIDEMKSEIRKGLGL